MQHGTYKQVTESLGDRLERDKKLHRRAKQMTKGKIANDNTAVATAPKLTAATFCIQLKTPRYI